MPLAEVSNHDEREEDRKLIFFVIFLFLLLRLVSLYRKDQEVFIPKEKALWRIDINLTRSRDISGLDYFYLKIETILGKDAIMVSKNKRVRLIFLR